MSGKAMSLKGKIKNYAKSNNIAAQVVLCLNGFLKDYRCQTTEKNL